MFNIYKTMSNCCDLEDSIKETVQIRIPNQVIHLPRFVKPRIFLEATDDPIRTTT